MKKQLLAVLLTACAVSNVVATSCGSCNRDTVKTTTKSSCSSCNSTAKAKTGGCFNCNK